jgi:transcriptional regulator with XRE-family HTH domain
MTAPVPFGGRTYEFGIADRLRISRELTGLDQREFAEQTGLSRATISNYERGIHRPRWPQIIVWALATGFDPAWLRDGQVTPDGPTRGKPLTVLPPNRFHATNYRLAA